ncbi:MAG: DMT family transporter [Alphaproteobacteria bacterium]|nr:DMT family transporter [Alphaproteobacteria bacterium]
MPLDPTYRRGVILVTAATIIWSSAGLLARIVDIDPWTTLFWRSVYAGMAIMAYLLWRDGKRLHTGFLRLGVAGVAMGVCFALSMISFIYGLSLTSVATTLIFQAAAPLIAAGLAFLLLGERVSRGKFIAILVSFMGVLVIVGGAADLRSLWAVAVAAVCGISYAVTVVLARARPDVPTTEATVLALLIVGTTTAAFAQMSLPGWQMAVMALFGSFQMGLGLILFTTGGPPHPRRRRRAALGARNRPGADRRLGRIRRRPRHRDPHRRLHRGGLGGSGGGDGAGAIVC